LKISVQKVKRGNRFVGKGRYFLEHEKRRQYRSAEFLPGREAPDGVLNLYRGLAIVPKEGNCEKFLAFVKEVICAGDEEIANWLLDYIAHMYQKPWEAPEVAILLRGRQGVGKSFFVEGLGEILGDYFLSISHQRHLIGSFNVHLVDKLLVLADEFNSKERQNAGILKSLVTQSIMAVEPKGVNVFSAKKYFRLFPGLQRDLDAAGRYR
jgi:phage/plasmid-associated DNA primase